MDLCFCVVIYNSSISNSKTVTSLLKYADKLSHLNIILYIHNNGPKQIAFDNVKLPDNMKLEKREYLNSQHEVKNVSLASIYNKAINEIKARYTCILDQDSELTQDYIQAVNSLIEQNENLLLPIIHGNGEIHSPRIFNSNAPHGEIIKEKRKLDSSNFLRSVGSGIVLSKNIATLLTDKFLSVFDERFYIYKADTIFFYRLKDLPNFTITVDGYINHTMASLNKESRKSKLFRKMDTAAGWALQEKYYEKTGLFRFILKALNKYILGGMKIKLYNTSITAFYSGRHPFVKIIDE